MERIQVTVPEQPPAGTVVLSVGGVAWQRLVDREYWYPANASDTGLPWPQLVVDCGPLDVLHRGEGAP